MAAAASPASPPPAPTLVGDVLRLRPWSASDAEPLAAALQDSLDSVGRWLDWCTPSYSADDARRWIAGVAASWAGRGEGEHALAIVAGDTLAGCIGANRFRPGMDTANLGYWLCRDAQGLGLMPQAIRLFAPWALARFGLRRLELVVATENLPSRRAAERAGARFEGVGRGRLTIHGRVHDAAVYVLGPEDFDH